jgi:hypothetical protein
MVNEPDKLLPLKVPLIDAWPEPTSAEPENDESVQDPLPA